MTFYPNKNLVDEDGNFRIPVAPATWATNLSTLKDINFEPLMNADKEKIYLLAYVPWKNYFTWVALDNPELEKKDLDSKE